MNFPEKPLIRRGKLAWEEPFREGEIPPGPMPAQVMILHEFYIQDILNFTRG